MYYFKNRKKKGKGKKMYVAQQRVYLTKKEGQQHQIWEKLEIYLGQLGNHTSRMKINLIN